VETISRQFAGGEYRVNLRRQSDRVGGLVLSVELTLSEESNINQDMTKVFLEVNGTRFHVTMEPMEGVNDYYRRFIRGETVRGTTYHNNVGFEEINSDEAKDVKVVFLPGALRINGRRIAMAPVHFTYTSAFVSGIQCING